MRPSRRNALTAIDPHILQKVGTTTPSSITPTVAALARGLAPAATPRHVPVRPEPDAKIGECFHNVLAKVDRDGGQILYGWTIWMWPRVFVEAEHHAVWDDGTGRLTDVTPQMHGERRIMFLPDPARVYDFEGKSRLGNVKQSIGEVPAAQDWIGATDRLARFIEEHSNGEQITFDRREVAPLAWEVERTKADVMVSLALRTGPKDPCVCGSGQRFKKCCGPFIDLDAG